MDATINKWAQIAQNLIFPPDCLLCGAPGIAGLDLCRGCWRDLPFLGPQCLLCATPLPVSAGERLCGRCQIHPPRFAARALLHYRWPVTDLLHGLKYHGRLDAGRLLGSLLGLRLRRGPAWPLVPVPLHAERLRQRGFNQAAELARAAAQTESLPLRQDVLTRTRPTADQVGLDAAARRRNLRRAFAPAGPVPGRLYLVDDVLTTGATTAEAAATLARHGAREIRILALARAGKA